MDFSLNITPRISGGIKAKMPETKNISEGVGYIMSAQDFKYRKIGSSLAFDVYKLPDLISKIIYKFGKAMITDNNQRRNYSNGFKETLRFLKSAAKSVK